jgi:adenylate cyclase class 2
MAVETEIKLRLTESPERARALLERHRFQAIRPRQLETDQTFDLYTRDLSTGELKRSGRLLRLRSTGGRWTVTYKGPPDASTKHKSREEIETEVSDGSAFTQILERLGYRPSFAYEKFRTVFKAEGDEGIVTLDETPIGDFLELEGPGYWIDETAVTLGFGPADYITSSYAALYEEHRRTHATVPRDMQFHRP